MLWLPCMNCSIRFGSSVLVYCRYLFALQVKQDLSTGRLVCNTNTTAILSAYIAQGELGDYNEEEMPDHTYLKCISFIPNQTDELEQCIMQYHRGFGWVSSTLPSAR